MESIKQLLELGDKMCSLTLALLLTFTDFFFLYFLFGVWEERDLKLRMLSDEQHLVYWRSLAVICFMQYMCTWMVDPPTDEQATGLEM